VLPLFPTHLTLSPHFPWSTLSPPVTTNPRFSPLFSSTRSCNTFTLLPYQPRVTFSRALPPTPSYPCSRRSVENHLPPLPAPGSPSPNLNFARLRFLGFREIPTRPSRPLLPHHDFISFQFFVPSGLTRYAQLSERPPSPPSRYSPPLSLCCTFSGSPILVTPQPSLAPNPQNSHTLAADRNEPSPTTHCHVLD